MPVPDLVSVPVPLMIPDAVVIPALVPPKIAAVVSVIAPDAVAVPVLLTMEPLIVNGSAVVNPFKSIVAPDAMVVAPDTLPNAALFPN